MTVIDSVDVSDICDDVDEVAIFDDDAGRYRAKKLSSMKGTESWMKD